MPNIGTVLRQEITRLSRRETRSEIDTMRKATAQHRHDLAALKRQIAALERQVALLSRKVLAAPAGAAPAPAAAGRKVRFAAKGLRAQRERLRLSAGDFGRLLGVSAQAVYNWERGSVRPRATQIAKIAGLRTIGKREAQARLAQAGAARETPARKG